MADDRVKIRVKIANRVYPLNINSQNEEEGMRKAAQRINDLVARFEEDYAVSDKQDVLAMCALQFASTLEIQKINNSDKEHEAKNRLNDLHNLLVDRLK